MIIEHISSYYILLCYMYIHWELYSLCVKKHNRTLFLFYYSGKKKDRRRRREHAAAHAASGNHNNNKEDKEKEMSSACSVSIKEIQMAMEVFNMQQKPAKTQEEAMQKLYQFWNTQPVPKMGE